MKQETRLSYLWRMYAGGASSDEELEELASLLNDSDNDQLIRDFHLRELQATIPASSASDARLQAILAKIGHKEEAVVLKISFYKTAWFRTAAACVMLLAGIGSYMLYNSRQHETAQNNNGLADNEIRSGNQKATLTMDDGQTIVLDSTASKLLKEKGIVNTDDALSYAHGSEAKGNNTLSTPRGGQHTLVLSDGTKVWLNAASSIVYPTTFTGPQRVVKITGEAYLQVASDKSKPFFVQAGEMEVQVLGTSFNIQAYPDEKQLQATLVEGRMRVNVYKQSQLLIPGQQAQITEDKKIILVKDPDIDKVIAWKSGLFNFNGADIKTVMKQLERWYDIEVIYEGQISQKKFKGKMDRDLTLQQVLKILKDTEVKYRLEGRKLIILP